MSALGRFARGQVRVRVVGADVERLMTRCARAGAVFWDVNRSDVDTLTLATGVEGYFLLRRHARRAMCRVRVTGKSGLPFIFQRLSRRWGLIAGGLLAVAIAVFLSGFIWTIHIDGLTAMPQRELLTMLREAGLAPGTARAGFDGPTVENQVLLKSDKLSFLAINLEGTHAHVVAREAGENPLKLPDETPCDVVSDKAGVVAALRVRQGTAKTRVGETLMPGDVIAGGQMISKLGAVWQVHADAEADLRVWRTLTATIPAAAESAAPTGNQITRRAIVIGTRRINLYMIESAPFPCYDKQVEVSPLTLGDDFRLPLALVTETYTETEAEAAPLSRLEAADLLERALRARLALLAPDAQILSAAFELSEISGALVGTLKTETLEIAGVPRAIQ
jgi:similar to stage IV sporulation protein